MPPRKRRQRGYIEQDPGHRGYVMESGAAAEIALTGNEGLVGISLFMGGETTPSRAVVQSAGQAYRLKGSVMKEEFARYGAFLHLFNERAVRLLGAVHRVHLIAVGALDYQGINLALTDRPQHVLGFGQARAQRLGSLVIAG